MTNAGEMRDFKLGTLPEGITTELGEDPDIVTVASSVRNLSHLS
ncbi:MAG: hypothetical protein J07HX5_00121 [halophilic archaeon J07HX5]|nr:MAG: hypothetical protein J07HX5_00121 [halophilic archaeon J07HX5]